jgi:hypothetical protein
MGIEEVPLGIMPTSTRNNPGCACERSQGKKGEEGHFEGVRLNQLSTYSNSIECDVEHVL